MKTADLLSGCAGLAFSLAICYGALQMPMGTVGNPGAGFLPFWIGVALGLMSLTLVTGALLERAASAGTDELYRDRVAWTVAGLLAYALVLETLGYLLTTVLLLSLVVRILGRPGWYQVLGFSVLATGGSYVLFGLWLGVPLPRGVVLP